MKGEELSAYGAKFSQASMALDRVPAESEAYKLGLRSGDLLLSLGGKEISTAASFKQLLEEYAGKSGELLVMRNQKEMVVKLAAFRGEMQPVEGKSVLKMLFIGRHSRFYCNFAAHFGLR